MVYQVCVTSTFIIKGKVVVHGVAPTMLVWAGSYVIASGPDKKLVCYSPDGRAMQQIDYNRVPNEYEISAGVSSNCGQMVALGSFDKSAKSSFLSNIID